MMKDLVLKFVKTTKERIIAVLKKLVSIIKV
jgi:hypothetical protein